MLAMTYWSAKIHVRAGGFTFAGSPFVFSSRRRHTIFDCDWSSDVCSSDLLLDLLDLRVVGDDARERLAVGAPGLLEAGARLLVHLGVALDLLEAVEDELRLRVELQIGRASGRGRE